MDKYLYVAMTGASQNALAQKAHANNLANISTNGFQRDLEQARSMPVFGDSFPARAFAMTERPATDFSPGAMIETGRDLDVAVSGDGWMAVQTPDGGEAYVRSASMNVDALGVLRAGNGMPIMGNGGPIAVPPQQKIEVGSDGTIHTKDGQPAQADANVRLTSGFLQASNVNAVEEMTAVLALAKQFELHIKMMNSAKEDDQAMTRVMQMS